MTEGQICYRWQCKTQGATHGSLGEPALVLSSLLASSSASEGAPPLGTKGDWASRQLYSRVRVQSLALTWHTASPLWSPPSFLGSWARDLDHVPALLIICNVTLGKSCPLPCCKTSRLDLMTSSQVTSLALTYYFHFPHLSP